MGRGFEPHGAHVISLSQIHRTRDYLTHEKLWIESLQNSNIEYRNGYFLTKSGRWRGFDWSDIRDQSLTGKTLIIGHSDDDVTVSLVEDLIASSNPSRIFATNLTAKAAQYPMVEDLPLGIPNDERQSKTHIIQADHSLLRKAWARSKPPRNPEDHVIYANFSVRNHREARGPALEEVSTIEGTRIGKFVLSKKGRLQDFVAMRSSGIVLCPRGAGMDTHRFWECLLVGAIPAVLESDHSARLARKFHLPTISLESWSQLQNRDWLNSEVEAIRKREWDMTALTASFWKTKISEQVATATN